MLGNIIKVILATSVILLVSCGRNCPSSVESGNLVKYHSITVKYWRINPWHVLSERRSMEEFLAHSDLDSLIIYDTCTVNHFMDRIRSTTKVPIKYDTIQPINLIIGEHSSQDKMIKDDKPELYTFETDIWFAAFAESESIVDTIGFGLTPDFWIQYNKEKFKDSTLFYSLLSMIWDNDSLWRQENKDAKYCRGFGIEN